MEAEAASSAAEAHQEGAYHARTPVPAAGAGTRIGLAGKVRPRVSQGMRAGAVAGDTVSPPVRRAAEEAAPASAVGAAAEAPAAAAAAVAVEAAVVAVAPAEQLVQHSSVAWAAARSRGVEAQLVAERRRSKSQGTCVYDQYQCAVAQAGSCQRGDVEGDRRAG